MSKSKWTANQLAAIDPGYWASLFQIKLQTGIFDLKKHGYQREPMACEARRTCCMKATQGGWTEMEILKALHGMIYKKYVLGVLYMFPTADNVREFSQSRFAPLIAANIGTIGKFVKSGGQGTDTTTLKKIHNAFLYLRGARLNQSIGNSMTEKESAQVRSIPVDRDVFDELDLMDMAIVQKALGRMDHSTRKEESYLSNPTLPGYGIAKIFEKSDQRYWFRKCRYCGHYTSPDYSFPNCVKQRKDGTGCIACDKCGREIDIMPGEWVAKVPANHEYMTGWHWSQLNSAFVDPIEIVKAYNEPPLGNLGDVMRLKLGKPYVAADDKLTISDVESCCTLEPQRISAQGPCAMGVDVGKIKHIVIGNRIDKERFEIIKTIALSKWSDIHDIAMRFNVKSAVIDLRPYEDAARVFQKQEPYRIFLCEYTENPTTDLSWDNKTGSVKAYRTGIFDRTHRLFTEHCILIPRKSPETDEFIEQVCGTAKVLELNKRTGLSVYRYRQVGNVGDHYRNALNYFYMAAKGGHIAYERNKKPRATVADNNYVLI